MKEVRFPALTGYSALGVLAAMGLTRLLQEFDNESARLRWDPTHREAVMSGYGTVSEVVEVLCRIVNEIEDDAFLPGIGHGYPPHANSGSDPFRVPQDQFTSTTKSYASTMSPGEYGRVLDWQASMLTDLPYTRDPQMKNKIGLSQMYAPTGMQKFAGSLLKLGDSIRAHPHYLREALEEWHRYKDVTGDSFDAGALKIAPNLAGAEKDTPAAGGVPGATWLAFMSMPLFRTGTAPITTSHEKSKSLAKIRTTGWHTINGRERLRLPLWEKMLTPQSITVLVEHPELGRECLDYQRLKQLGVFYVVEARRYIPDGVKFQGALETLP